MRAYSLWCLVLLGCSGSRSVTGGADALTDAALDADVGSETSAGCTDLWDCNPGIECGEMIPCEEGVCREDLRVYVPCDLCETDEDCVVAAHWCCALCNTIALARGELGRPPFECYYDSASPPPGLPPAGCMEDCGDCHSCYPQTLTAVCLEGGLCVPEQEGCPYTGEEEPVEVTAAALFADPGAWEGDTVRVTGTPIARWPTRGVVCEWPREECYSASLYLDGLVRLAGWPCEMSIFCEEEDACPLVWDCGPFPEGHRHEMTGVVTMAGRSPAIQVMGVTRLDPAGVGGRYTIRVSAATSWPEVSGVTCPVPVAVGEEGMMLVADAEGALVLRASIFGTGAGCGEFEGTREGDTFDAMVPIECDGCCCDYEVAGSFPVEGSVTGTYTSFDGACHVEVVFEGSRS
jgi:hypothetical protein